MAKKNIIPKIIATGVPKKCPVCKKDCAAVFRNWKTTGRVSCEFVHYTGNKICRKTYDEK
jgi:hypothetical protein